MAKRINWRKMNQITSLYEEGLKNFREILKKYQCDIYKQETLEDLVVFEHDIKNTLSIVNNYKNSIIYNIEKDNYILSKSLLVYFEEKENDISFLKSEFNAILSKTYLKIKDKKELQNISKQPTNDVSLLSNNPCPKITKIDKLRRFVNGLSFFHYRYIQFMFWIIVIVLLISIVGSLSKIIKENELIFDTFENFLQSTEESTQNIYKENNAIPKLINFP